MRQFFLFVFLLSAHFLFSQNFEYFFDYNGNNGFVHEETIFCVPDDVFDISFLCQSVPDKLTIYNNDEKTDSIVFYAGFFKPADLNTIPFTYTNCNEFIYDDSLVFIGNYNCNPLNQICGKMPYDGLIKLSYRAKKCKIQFKLEGNKHQSTYFMLCIKQIEHGQIPILDTLRIPFCGTKDNEIKLDEVGCKKTLLIYDDSTFTVLPKITHPICPESNDGKIEFEGYETFNKADLGVGQIQIAVHNSVCTLHFNLNLIPQKLCSRYVPSAYSPNGDGENDFFTVFAPIDTTYTLSVYDRWGNLVHQNQHMTNYGGWGGNGCSTGIYVYLIEIMGETIKGDITLLK